jgi:putative membrane protein
MESIIKLCIGSIAIFHIYILWMEMFAWETRGKKVFRSIPKDLFAKTKTLAANQGLYNGFLAAGLIWTFFISNTEWKSHISLFFLSCVSIAGIYGAITAEKKIFFVQSLPAIITILLILINS